MPSLHRILIRTNGQDLSIPLGEGTPLYIHALLSIDYLQVSLLYAAPSMRSRVDRH